MSGTGGVVITPELALVDPELAEAQRQTTERKAAMSSTPPSNGTFFVDPAQPASVANDSSPGPPPPAQAPVAPEPVPLPSAAAAPAPTPMVDVPLGTLIFRAGLLAEEQLEDALQEGMRTGKRLGEVLLERGWLHERDLGRLLAGQKGLPFVEVRGSDAEAGALQRLPEEKARLQTALPLRHEEGELVVAVADPSNELVLENLRRALGAEPRLVVATQGDLIRAIGEAYAGSAVVAAAPATPLAPEAQPLPSLQVEPVAAPAPPPASAPEPPAPAPVAAPTGPAPLPTVLPPPEERVAEPVVVPLQQPLAEPAAPAPVEQPAVASPAPVVEATPVGPAEPPAAPPEPVAADPAPLLQAAPPVAPEPAPVLTPAPLQPPVETVEATPAAEVAPQPEQQPVAPSPLVVEQPVESVPAPLAEQVQAEPPAADAEPEPAPASIHAVLIRLRDGDVLEAGTFVTAAEAAARAQEVVGQIAAAESNATWPFFGERYLRPETIVSVDLVEESADKWLGSPARSHWAGEN